jgi:hypothetical protein
VISFNEFYPKNSDEHNNHNLVKLKELANFREFEKILIIVDKNVKTLPEIVLKIFCEDLRFDKNMVRLMESVDDIEYEILSDNMDNFYVFMPINAMNEGSPLHCIFERMQPDKRFCLCLIGIPDMIDSKFGTMVEFPPISNTWSVFEGL